MFQSSETAKKIVEILQRDFAPTKLEIEDQSHLHRGHKQAGGGGHFFVHIESKRFQGLAPLARQRLVLDAMGTLMDREIHALSMKCVPSP